MQQKVPFSLIRCSSSKVAFCSCVEWGWHIYNIVESESDPLTRRAVDLFEKEPLKGNSEVHLHTPTKFGEIGQRTSEEIGNKQTDRQTDKQTNAARFIVWFFFFRTRDYHPKSPKPHHIQPPNSTHTWTLIRHIAARVLVLIRITVLDLEPDPCFQIFLNISETNYRIFNWNISNRRSSQELPFIFFELRAATCLWGRYDPKTENFTLFYIYLIHIDSLSAPFSNRV